MKRMEDTEFYQRVTTLRKEIQQDVIEHTTPVMIQYADTVRNSQEACQLRLEKMIGDSLNEIKELMQTFKSEYIERLTTCEKKIVEITTMVSENEKKIIDLQQKIILKWHSYIPYFIIILLMIFSYGVLWFK